MSERKKILIIEDDICVIDFLKYALEKEGFIINISADGIQGIKLIGKTAPDLIILDMMLPGKSGYEIIKILQAGEYNQIPIVIVTGRFAEDSYKKMLLDEPNVKEFIIKPIRIQFLLNSIYSILNIIPAEQIKVQEKRKKPEEETDPWKINI